MYLTIEGEFTESNQAKIGPFSNSELLFLHVNISHKKWNCIIFWGSFWETLVLFHQEDLEKECIQDALKIFWIGRRPLIVPAISLPTIRIWAFSGYLPQATLKTYFFINPGFWCGEGGSSINVAAERSHFKGRSWKSQKHFDCRNLYECLEAKRPFVIVDS